MNISPPAAPSSLLSLVLLAFGLSPALLAQNPPNPPEEPPPSQDEPWNAWQDPKQVRGPGDGRPAEGVDREGTWPAPTAEDWARPVQVTFQRTWEDAVAVARETNKPILVCVNMDGEIASEHYAGIRYRDPEIAQLYEPYVCVIASVYRHNPRDYDENGERILCPRFGSVTCGEHIAIEPILYDKFLDGTRVAPRHIMVELDGSEVYDIYYAWDTKSVFSTIQEGIERRDIEPRTIVRGDRPIVERVASRHIEDRRAVEKAYQEGNEELRRRLLEAARENPEAAPVDLLRLAIFGLDSELADLARDALARTDSEDAVGLILEALRVPLESEEREQLITALERIGESSPRAQTLAVVQRGLDSRESSVDAGGWSQKLAGATYQPAADAYERASRLGSVSDTAQKKKQDPAAQLELAEASLSYAVDPEASQNLGDDPKIASQLREAMLEDARSAARRAKDLGASGWRVNTVLALSNYYLGDKDAAYALAETAAQEVPAGDTSWNAMAVLGVFAEARRQAILDALDAKEDWPREWLTDVHSTYAILAQHPRGTDGQVAAHYDFLDQLGAAGKATRVLQDGLRRYPSSSVLHDRLRGRIIADRGLEGLKTTYESMLAREDASPELGWYAGLAMMVTAEFHRRKGRLEEGVAAYDDAIEYYERFIEAQPDDGDSADHYIALALAGKSRIAFIQSDLEKAVDLLIASFEREPQAAATLDGLNVSPADTARALRARLERAEEPELLAKLEAALAKLDPELLRLPDYERQGPGDGQRRRRRNRGGR